MADSYDLSKLGPDAFENIVNFLALKTLGLGSTGFGPGADGGRDGYFEGEAPYPSETERWKGVWYIQSKFHKPHLSNNPQKWLIEQVKKEIAAFDKDNSDRIWPDYWIIATNIDPSGKPETGSFDAIKKFLNKSPRGKKVKLHIWGGRKILDLLALHGDVAKYYSHFLTPGHVVSALYAELTESRASIKEIIRYFVVTQFTDNIFTKLDQAGSSSDVRPGVHDLFIDLPFSSISRQYYSEILAELCCAAAQCHRYSLRNEFPDAWRGWNRHSKRARVSLIKGGPGQGKSTVSQYLCQIHRASLILAGDELIVNDSVKEHANAISNAAQRDSFWPTSPRIPIQIELKEFAHWYSQRKPDKAKNVLTYLSETVAKKIGSEVKVKTLKNAISKRSWIVIFDGLDEVPNDFKDEVANEVMYFLNDVLVEIDGDVLALCTSRPQGYSGQFAGIDGPVVELSLLDDATAMRCAEPVLKFGRTEEESEKSIETLKAAILSPNVKELMTTPLQSHIMAIVVRDGGRPPERRWKLFDGFYQVMKKRESLKDFKNPRIARLLREEEKLLKSVHMRLGFVLHARAERSEGAQTALSRNEFQNLVKDVVTELDDHDIEQTVADVMEAITERLVLVSTPENGEQVRFDIRQLQEFFAAEFLYAGVDSAELRERIETIGADAHWREVMHFLMSALIENQRTTEVTVAVQVLCQLNEGEESSADRLYHRRMAKATLLASRLLVEGVLEQDKGDRQKVKPLLEPLGGIFDLNIMRGLGRITPTRSRQWLIQFLLDKVETANPREYVGALFLLGWLLSNNHIKSVEVSNAFLKAPIGWQEQLYKLWLPSESPHHHRLRFGRHQSDETLSQWVIDLAVDILNSENWVKYSSTLITRLLIICKYNSQLFVTSCEKKGIEESIANAILYYLKNDEVPSDEQNEKGVDCGLLKGKLYFENWMNGKTPTTLIGINARKYVDSTEGAFRLMLTCMWFAEEQSGGALKEFIKLADHAGSEKIGVLPNTLLALLPIEGEYSMEPFSVNHLRDINTTNDNWLVALKAEQKIQPSYQIHAVNETGKSTSDQWALFSVHFPRIAIDFALDPEGFPWKVHPQFVPELKLLILNMPYHTQCHFLKWGSLQESQPELLQSLRKNVCAITPEKGQFRFHSFGKPIPFELKFPEEIHLLSVLAPALIEWFENIQQFSLWGESNMNEEKSLQTLLSAYGLSASQLKDFAESSSIDKSVRASALALYWLLQLELETNLDLIQEKKLYRELVNEINEEWLTCALIRGVLIRHSETDVDALAFVTYLMERCHDGGGPCNELIELLGSWRERSTAPVNSKGVLQKWLGYNLQIPAYLSK